MGEEKKSEKGKEKQVPEQKEQRATDSATADNTVRPAQQSQEGAWKVKLFPLQSETVLPTEGATLKVQTTSLEKKKSDVLIPLIVS